MTTLRQDKLTLPACDYPAESTLPFLKGMSNVQQQTKTRLDEDDGLFIGYGFVQGSYPHREMNDYAAELSTRTLDTVVLENNYLRAEFIPRLGGRLWSLVDKTTGRELLFKNPVFRPANLAVRNAWFAGGVEWNIGIVGHHAYTCSPLFTATLTDSDGTPVLRMYEYERIRGVTYQMDFFLPEDSRLLLCRMRIVNPNAVVVPMYWWSNIAVPELPDGRIIVPTTETYTNKDHMVSKTTVPFSEGIDITVPVNLPHSVDYFFNLPQTARKYICHLDGQGYGLVQLSTARLQGRKLFAWGQGPGGDRWQRVLSGGDENARYIEIQAGLAHTQYECLPMQPQTAWEWLEGYGAMQADGGKAHGGWDCARAEVGSRLEALISDDEMERILHSTKQSIALKKADKLLVSGSGWGALEAARRRVSGDYPLPEHLDFGVPGQPQDAWVSLMNSGTVGTHTPTAVPISYISGEDWERRLCESTRLDDSVNWYAHYQLGCLYLSKQQPAEAKNSFEAANRYAPTAWAYYGLSLAARAANAAPSAVAALCVAAAKLAPNDRFLARETADAILASGDYAAVRDFCAALPPVMAAVDRVRLALLQAVIKLGELDAALEIFGDGSTFDIHDIREGELTLTELWYSIEELRACHEGLPFDRSKISPPAHLDYRAGFTPPDSSR